MFAGLAGFHVEMAGKAWRSGGAGEEV